MNDSTANDTGALGASGRFARMEAALDRIELKLDLKADVALVQALELRLAQSEQRIADMYSGAAMSPRGVELLNRFENLERTVDSLEDESKTREAIVRTAREDSDRKYDRLMWVVGIVTLANMLVNFLTMRFTL